jgi:hypothetical protein
MLAYMLKFYDIFLFQLLKFDTQCLNIYNKKKLTHHDFELRSATIHYYVILRATWYEIAYGCWDNYKIVQVHAKFVQATNYQHYSQVCSLHNNVHSFFGFPPKKV